jgi:osmotically-inducible protein OsmY
MAEPRVISTQGLRGLRVRNAAGEDLGRIEDFLLDPEYGRMAYAVISFGELLGLGDKLFAVPIEALRLSPDGGTFLLNVDKKVLERAPGFERDRWPDVLDRDWGRATYTHYGYRPYWEGERVVSSLPRVAEPAAPPAPPIVERSVVLTRRANTAAWAVTLVLLLAVGAGIGWLVYTRGWASARDTIATSAHAAYETSVDAATTARVKTALALSKRISSFDINVDSRQGTVTLRGQVPTPETRELAEAITRNTSGVADVRNELVVDASARPDSTRAGLSQRVADLEVRTSVREHLAKTPELDAAKIDVRVDQGNVTLTGSVETPMQKARAERITWGQEGVVRVTNELHVTNPQGPAETADDRLAKRVEFALYSTRALDVGALRIQSQDGTVTLSGTVRNPAERLLAEKVAKEVDGVRRIENNVSVSPAAQ